MARQKRPDRFFRLSPSVYEGLHRRYARLIDELPISEYMALDKETGKKLSGLFDGMMKAVYKTRGGSFSIDLLAAPQVREFIGGHAAVLDSSFAKVEMSEAMRRRLQRSDYIFSGLKTFHELNEAFPALIDSDGNRKPFERFLNDVRKIDRIYNRNYLRAEYNFAVASAEMAAKWDRFAEDGDEYNLQYRTVGDERVRPEHAALNGVTLPMSDPFWAEYYPPNGWNCRCSVTQVRKSKYPVTDHDEAMERGAEALQRDKKGMFHFNPGIEGKTFPDYNPYTISRCRDCDIAKGKGKFARITPADNVLCAACPVIRRCSQYSEYTPDKEFGERLMINDHADPKDLQDNIKTAKVLLREFPDMKIQIRPHVYEGGVKNPEYCINGLVADRKAVKSEDGVASGFVKAIKQGCSAIVFDLDEHLKDKPFYTGKFAQAIGNRYRDFETGAIKEVIVIKNNKAVIIRASELKFTDRRSCKNEIEPLLKQIAE